MNKQRHKKTSDASLESSGSKRKLSEFTEIDTVLLTSNASISSLGDLNGQLPEPNDKTISFVLKPHSITMLICMLIYFLYIALYETTNGDDIVYNTKIGFAAIFTLIIMVGLLMFPDGHFIRPHPAFWRIVLACGVAYLYLLVFILFQSVETVRHWLSLYDPILGVKLPEKLYAIDCSLTWDVIWDKMDIYVICHVLGWYAKALMLRDYWICWIFSIMFEFLEYQLEYQLPNFGECWWDHWIMDVLICNGLGVYVGMSICKHFKMKMYHWNGKTKNYGLMPVSWTSFEWAYNFSFKNYLVTIFVVSMCLIGELNAFYLKHLLWIPVVHHINIIRLLLILLMGLGACRDAYQYFYDNNCKTLGAFAWITAAIVFTEVTICIKFGRGEFPDPMPQHVFNNWMIFFIFLILYPAYQFYLREKIQCVVRKDNKPIKIK